MRFRAAVSFAGTVSMAKNEEKEIADEAVISDLLRAGYIEPVETETKEVISDEGKRSERKQRKKSAAD